MPWLFLIAVAIILAIGGVCSWWWAAAFLFAPFVIIGIIVAIVLIVLAIGAIVVLFINIVERLL